MSDALKEAVVAWLKTLQAGADFVIDQAPLVVQEKILYGRITETLWCVVGLGVCLVAYLLWRQTLRLARCPVEESVDKSEETITLGLISFLATVAGVWTAGSFLNSALQAWFAPRLYVLEWLKGLLS